MSKNVLKPKRSFYPKSLFYLGFNITQSSYRFTAIPNNKVLIQPEAATFC